MRTIVVIIIGFSFFSSASFGNVSSVGAISGAQAGAGRSSVDIGESYILNPATVAHLRGAAISMGTSSFRDSQSSSNGSQRSHEGWRLSLNENAPDSMWGSSIYLSQIHTQPSNDNLNAVSQLNDAWFTVGNFILPRVSVGLSYHYHESQTLEKTYQEHNLGMGILWTPTDYLGVGLSLQNMRAPPDDIPASLTQGSNTGVGLLYLHENYLRLRLDYSRKNNKLPSLSANEWAFGLENSMTPWALVRIGAAQETSDEQVIQRKVSFGLGFSGPRFGINYGLQQFQMAKQGTEHSVDLLIPF